MAVWFRETLLVLRKSIKSSLLAGFVISVILIILAIQFIFSRLEVGHSQTVAAVVGSILRNESTMSRSYLLAQSIEDIQAYGAITCARLSKIEKGQASVFYDSTYKANCSASQLTKIELPGLDGNVWQFEIIPNLGLSFYAIKWLTLSSAVLLLFVLYRALKEMFERQERTIESIETKRLFLEQLTEQVRHDVASPISALKMIAERAPLDSETKDFLRQAVSRTSAIFQDLKQLNSKPQSIHLETELTTLVNEKVLSRENFPRVRINTPNVSLTVDKKEFGRMISNLLDNAHEAGATWIEIRVSREQGALQIVFADDGRPIPESVKSNLGVRGNTIGKATGSGLGLFHAYRFMQAMGGSLSISKREGEKFLLTIIENDAW